MAAKKIKLLPEDRWYYILVYTIAIVLTITVLYPVIYIVSSSFSSGVAVSTGKVIFLPVDFTIEGYRRVFTHPNIWLGYRNTIFYTVVGTLNNVIFTMFCAYPLSRKEFIGRKTIMFILAFTMYFSGGMIPGYLLLKDLGYINTIWAMIMPGSFSIYQMIVCRTFINSTIPNEMLEAAKIDGCNDHQYFFKFVLPLSKPIIAVMALQYAVGHWNSYFGAFIYLNNPNLYPLQIFLREILILGQVNPEDIIDEELQNVLQGMADVLKYALIVVATAPIMVVYPFIQKYFVQGIMIGSLKG